MPAPIDQSVDQINASISKVSDQLKAYAEQTKADLASQATLTASQREKVDELLTAQAELRADLRAAEQQLASLQAGGHGGQQVRSLGQIVAESDALTGFNAGAQGSAVTVRVGSVHAAITSGSGSAGVLIEPTRVPGIIAPGQQRLFVRDLLSWGRTASNSIEFVREDGFTNNAAVVAENPSAPKPESDITFELDSAPVATIAHWVRASKQVLADAGMLQAYIDGRLTYGLKLKEEAQLLKGSGAGLNIKGLMTHATSYTNPGVSVQHETAIDRLRIAMLQAELAEYTADGIVLSPIDWTQIELTKTNDNGYLFATPRGLATPGLWGRPVVASQSMTAGDFLVGAFALGAQGWDREDANITISNQDRDNFVKNMVTILCEERVGLTVYRPEAFVSGTFAGVAPLPSSGPASSGPVSS